jgi:hypothetical protein
MRGQVIIPEKAWLAKLFPHRRMMRLQEMQKNPRKNDPA